MWPAASDWLIADVKPMGRIPDILSRGSRLIVWLNVITLCTNLLQRASSIQEIAQVKGFVITDD